MGSGICWAFHKIPLGRILYEPYAFVCIDEIQLLHNLFAQPRHSDRRLCYGGEVTLISSLGGNVIVKVKESRVAISEEMARKIMV